MRAVDDHQQVKKCKPPVDMENQRQATARTGIVESPQEEVDNPTWKAVGDHLQGQNPHTNRHGFTRFAYALSVRKLGKSFVTAARKSLAIPDRFKSFGDNASCQTKNP